jgi:hypothetical protein
MGYSPIDAQIEHRRDEDQPGQGDNGRVAADGDEAATSQKLPGVERRRPGEGAEDPATRRWIAPRRRKPRNGSLPEPVR